MVLNERELKYHDVILRTSVAVTSDIIGLFNSILGGNEYIFNIIIFIGLIFFI